MSLLFWLAATLVGLSAATLIVDLLIKAPSASGPESDHFDGRRFSNLNDSKARGFLDIIKWAFSGEKGDWRKLTEDDISYGMPPQELNSDGGKSVFTFVNHSTFLIQTHGLNILTDPIWSDRASPYQWIGPQRMRPPGVRFEDLPDIHLVLISHNHYDHLDIDTVVRLSKTHDPLFIVPLGVAAYLEKDGVYNAVELDWWQQHEYNDALSVSGVPAQHFSGRGITDRDKTLWCGYVLELPEGNIYFAGDTGYDGFFGEIGRRYAPIDTALIPIGAYRPRWFMQPIHVNPEEAVKVHLDVGARQSIGMHFGTFPLADDGMQESLKDLAKARKKYGLAEDDFITIPHGDDHRRVSATESAAVG